MNKKAMSGWGLVIVAVLIVIGIILGISGVPLKTTSHGEHTGTVTAVEDDGIIFSTVRVYFKSDVQASTEDIYCVKDSSVIAQLQQAAQDKAKVTIIYEDYLHNGWKNCKSGDVAIITGIK